MLTVLKWFVVSNDKVSGRVLWLDIGGHCLLKKLIKILAFSTKFVISLLLINKKRMIGAFFQSTKLLIIDQCILDDVVGLLRLSPRRLKYLLFEKFIASVN